MKYLLMHKNVETAVCEIDEVDGSIYKLCEVLNPLHFPLGIEKTRHGLNSWFAGRRIPASRDGMDDVLAELNLTEKGLQFLSVNSFGLSLSDQYWVKPSSSPATWESVNFYQNNFSDDFGNFLFGNINSGDIDIKSPDTTTDGWLKKKWIIDNGSRYLIKSGSGREKQEPLNEALASEICERMGFPHVRYELDWLNENPVSRCADFIDENTEFIPAAYIAKTLKQENNKSLYQHFLSCCNALEIPNVREQLKNMLALDFLIANSDRHWGNFGAIRNADTLDWIGTAPIFDCGTAMFHDRSINQKTVANAPAKPFRKTHDEQIKLIEDLSRFDVNKLIGIESFWRELLKKTPNIDEGRKEQLCTALSMRVEMLGEIVEEQSEDEEFEPEM